MLLNNRKTHAPGDTDPSQPPTLPNPKTPDVYADKSLQLTLSQLKRINQTKDQLLTKIGHELLTPLNGIMGSLELAMKTYHSNQHMQLLSTALNSANKLNDSIRDIVDLSQLSRGELKVARKNFVLKDVLDSIITSAERDTKEKGLQWKQSIKCNLDLEVRGDGHRIAQVLKNLISNAIKFTDHGHVKVALDGAVKDKRLLLFKATIEDSGIGISKEDQQQIFQNFYQVEEFCNRHHHGSGVGLSLAYLLVKQMRGEISVQSIPGKGSRFEVVIPMPLTKASEHNLDQIRFNGKRTATRKATLTAVKDASLPQEQSSLAANVGLAPKPEDDGLKLNGHVLIVEDNSVNQMILKGLVNKVGLTSEIASNGKLALDKLDQGTFNLVLMDCQMPVMDGFTCSKEIRQRHDQHRNIPIVAITANVTEEDRSACFAAGMNDFLNKPIKPDLLYPALTKWLNYWEELGLKKS